MKYYYLIKVLFTKHCVIIYSIYFQESSNVKSVPETQGPLTPGKKNNDLNNKENDLKLQYCIILKLQLETFLNCFKIRNLCKGTFKNTFAQNSRILTPPPCSPLFVFQHPSPFPLPLKVRSFWLELTLSHSISILVKFREKKIIMCTSGLGWTQRVF